MLMKNKVILATLLLIAFLFFVFFNLSKEDNLSEVNSNNESNQEPVVSDDSVSHDTEEKPVNLQRIAEGWIVNNLATYRFNGRNLAFLKAEGNKLYFTFESTSAGYGDRTGQMSATVITPHTIEIVVEDGQVVSAITDGRYNEMTGEYLNEATNSGPVAGNKDMILFYGDGCPACKALDQLIKEKGIDEKLSYDSKEVYYNKENSNQLVAKARECGLNTDSIGIPFLWADGNCHIGVEPIMNYFEGKTHD